MKTKPARTAPHLAAFISHASKDSRWASRLVDSLKADGLPPWIDHSDVRFGQLLRNELTSAIQASRVLVLVWSKAASASRWVIAEESLGVQPMDASALNGLGSILMFERELDAAEFFQRRAIAVMKRAGRKYPEAQHDLDLVLYFKRKQVDPSA